MIKNEVEQTTKWTAWNSYGLKLVICTDNHMGGDQSHWNHRTMIDIIMMSATFPTHTRS